MNEFTQKSAQHGTMHTHLGKIDLCAHGRSFGSTIRSAVRRSASVSRHLKTKVAQNPSSTLEVQSWTETSSRPLASSETTKESQQTARLFLQSELGNLFQTGRLTKEKYANNFKFQDPLASYTGFDTFRSSLAALRALFKIDFILHSTVVSSDSEITTRWTMELQPRLTPWIQKLIFTGRSIYTIDILSGGLITAQKDIWDAVQDSDYFSVESLAYLIRQITSGQTTPSLESPKYVVWKKTKDYEIRQYRAYLAAEVAMPSNAKPASGDGFQDLAGYIFGGNQRRESMEMTTPVFSTAGQDGTGKMSFPMEEKMGSDPNELPLPRDSRVTRTLEEAATVAVGSFGGLPLDYQVTDAERKLRGALLLDGIEAEEGYKLARYNDPFTPPFLRRNEVLIRLKSFELEPAA